MRTALFVAKQLVPNKHGPLAVCTILTLANGGKDPGFRPRRRMLEDVDAIVRRFYDNAVETYGYAHAACLLAHLLAKAPPGGEHGYAPPRWAIEVLSTHAELIARVFASREADKPLPKTSGLSDRTTRAMRKKLDAYLGKKL